MRNPLHDYAGGARYFVTAVTAKRQPLFGALADGQFRPSNFGEAVTQTLLSMPQYFLGLVLDAYCLMPDHMHVIVIITHLPSATGEPAKRYSLPQVMQAQKGMSARKINTLRRMPGTHVC